MVSEVGYETQNRENDPRESRPGQSAKSRAFDVDVCPSASHRDLAPVQIDLAAACTGSGKLSRKCEYPP